MVSIRPPTFRHASVVQPILEMRAVRLSPSGWSEPEWASVIFVRRRERQRSRFIRLSRLSIATVIGIVDHWTVGSSVGY